MKVQLGFYVGKIFSFINLKVMFHFSDSFGEVLFPLYYFTFLKIYLPLSSKPLHFFIFAIMLLIFNHSFLFLECYFIIAYYSCFTYGSIFSMLTEDYLFQSFLFLVHAYASSKFCFVCFYHCPPFQKLPSSMQCP